MSQLFADYASTQLLGPLTSVAANMTVLNGASFPAVTAGNYFYATLIDQASWEVNLLPPAQREVVKVTLTTGNVWTISRGAYGTAAQNWTTPPIVELRVSAQTLRDVSGIGVFLQIPNNLSDVANPLTATSNLQYKNPTTGGVARTVQAKLQDLDSPEDFGAVGDGVTDDHVAFQAMATAGGSYKLQPGKNYKLNSTITIPDGVHFKLIGDSFLGSTITTPGSATVAFQYVRVGASSTFEAEYILFQESGLGKLSFLCKWWGAAVGTDDNWSYFTRCSFKGYSHVHDVKFAQNCHYVECFYQGNSECFFFQRDASFQYIEDCLAINNGRCLNAQDATNDGVSNGIFVSDTTFALTTNEDIFCLGFQLVQLSNTTCDLGGTGANDSVIFTSCDDVRIIGGWIAVAIAAIGTRIGLQFNTCHNFAVIGVKFTGCHQAIFVSCTSAQNVSSSIVGCQFETSQVNDIILLGNVVGLTITGCAFKSTPSYTGSNFPVYANVAGNNNIIIANNWFVGVEYQLITPGKSVVTPNIFAGSAGADNFLVRYDASGNIVFGVDANNNIKTSGNLTLQVAGNGIAIKEGANASMGLATLVGGTVTVANTRVTANSRIFLTEQATGGAPGFVRISARTAGTSFTILSSSGTDTSTVAWLIVEPAP